MNNKSLVRPKGSAYPFQPIKAEEDGMYAIEWQLRNGVRHTAWYEADELEIQR